MKKLLALILICIMAIGTLSACSNPDSNESVPDGEKSLTVSTLGDLTAFTTRDMNGAEVTQDILKDYDVTMVNVWTTWCDFCVKEMPAIAKLKEKVPSNTTVITICADGKEAKELANRILSDSKATFQTLVPSETLNKKLLKNIWGYPTTFFVDKTGKVVGDIMENVPSDKEDEIIDAYLKKINIALKEVEGKK